MSTNPATTEASTEAVDSPGTETTTSADGTLIAYEAYGSGPVAIVVGGAFCDRGAFRELAHALASEGFTGVTYDRRGRGNSGDTPPYAVAREIEDIRAVVAAVSAASEGASGPMHAHGISSGGALVLQAVAAGGPISTASVLEPPYRIEGAPPAPERYIETLEELEAAGDREGIIHYFHTKAVGLPEEMLEGMKGTPAWEALQGMAFTIRYDGLCLGEDSTLPTGLLADIDARVLTINSTGTTLPFLPAAARAVAQALPNGTHRELEGGFHEVPAATLAPVIADFARQIDGGRRG